MHGAANGHHQDGIGRPSLPMSATLGASAPGASTNARARVRYTADRAGSGLAADAAGFVNGGRHTDEPGFGPPLMDGDHAGIDHVEAREVADDLLVPARDVGNAAGVFVVLQGLDVGVVGRRSVAVHQVAARRQGVDELATMARAWS